MVLPETMALLEKHEIQSVIICGIESHICVLQVSVAMRMTIDPVTEVPLTFPIYAHTCFDVPDAYNLIHRIRLH